MEIRINHDSILSHIDRNIGIDHDTRAGIWEGYSDILEDLSSRIANHVDAFFLTPNGYKDVDADNFIAFFEAIDALNKTVSEHAGALRKKADYWEERRVYHQENVYAWSLGLKPSILRAEGIMDWNRGIWDHHPSPWKDIAAFKSSPGISRNDTLRAIHAWREANRKAG